MKFNGRNVVISPLAQIGTNVKIGDNTVIYDNVEIGDNSIICNDCVLGEPLNGYYSDASYLNPSLKIGANSLIRSHSIIYAGSVFGDHLNTGHRVTIREQIKAGHHLSVGTLCDLQGFTTFGNYCRLHSNVHIGQRSTLGDFVFIYPYVILTNDPHPPSNICRGPRIGDYTQIAVQAVIMPDITIGRHCLIGSNSKVTKNFGDGLLVAGNPATEVGPVSEIRSKEKPGQMHYPWVYNFERGMPWEGIGYDEWIKQDSPGK
jgi:UDP-3-O-[3-hydroxymyristoyl] glucosamine N-acyltransferase